MCVTGLGVVSAFGLGHGALVQGVGHGTPALSPLSFAAPNFPHSEGACGPERRELARLLTRRKDLKLMSRDTLLAVAAGVLAWRDAGLEDAQGIDHEDVGLFLALGPEKGEVGDLALAAHASEAPAAPGRLDLGRLAQEGLPRIHPLDSLKTLPNMALAHLAMRLGLRGPNLALCGSVDASERAISEASLAISEGRCALALAGATDSLVTLSGYTPAWRDGSLGRDEIPGEAAVVLVLEEEGAAAARGVAPYGAARGLLSERQIATAVGRCGLATAPLARALAHAQAGRREQP